MNLFQALEWLAVRMTNAELPSRLGRATTQQSDGFVFGMSAEPEEPLILDLAVCQHIYMIGSSGSGKTTQLRRIIEADVAAGRSVAVIDLHGDLSPLILAALAEHQVEPQRVLFWNLADDDILPTINPLASGGEVHPRVNAIVSAIKRRSDSWGVQLDQSLRAILVSLAENGYSLLDVETAFMNTDFRSRLKVGSKDEYARSFLDRFELLSKEQQQLQLLAVSNKLTSYTADPRMRRLFGTGDLGQLRTAVNTPGQVILIAVPGYALGEMAGVLGELIIHTVWSTILARAQTPASKRVPIRLVIDEFQNATAEHFGSMVTEGRRFGLSLVLSHQSQAQLAAPLRSLIRNNSAVRVLLSPGIVDAGELALELAPLSHQEAVQAFMDLKVGEAFIVRRGEHSRKVILPDVRADRISAEAVTSFTRTISLLSGKEVQEIDRELAERTNALTSQSTLPLAGRKEVSHGRRPWR